ncbi:MAG: class I SAM-dependent methyltransferase [Thermoanaerobaculia bacterium]
MRRRTVLSRFAWAPLSTRAFIAARWLLTPYSRIAAYLPKQGTLLDLGCGHGLFALAARALTPDLRVIGIDHDEERVRAATRAGDGDSLLTFAVGDLSKPPVGKFDAISLLDLMHYFEPAQQERIFVRAYDQLKNGGTLLVREVEPRGGISSLFNRAWEKVMTASGLTRTDRQGLHFRSSAGWKETLEHVGFTVRTVPCSFFLFSDVLFVAEKKSAETVG